MVPLRCSFNHTGTVVAGPAVCTLTPFSAGRRWKATPFPGEANNDACALPGLRFARIMMPALVQALTS